MMTSVTLPSNSGPIPILGGFTSAVTTEDSSSVSERNLEPPRPVKRSLAASLTDSCKKRRKQATPVRISAADSPPEGKPTVPSPEPEIQCPVCQVVYNNPDLLQSHISSEHVTFECKQEPSDSLERPDSAIGQLQDQASKTELPWLQDIPNKEWMNSTLLPFPPANHMFMGLPGFTQHDSLPPRQPIRIFNPDAYCELCNKEFCNKYFLKTHKANKHGIYSDPPASETSSLGSSVNIPSFVTNMKIPNSVPSIDVSVKIESKTNLISSYPEIYSNPFTNKLFPKLTKPNIPGIFDPENPENSTSITTSSNGLSNSETEQRNAIDESAEDSSSPRVIQHDLNLMKQEIGSDHDGLFYTTPTSKMSPGQQARELDLSNRLRRIGVMNPKAFCEICCKEYCNKYFLRTHKMKRHGIFIPDDRDKDMKMDSLGMPYIQTSPLNLIMGEQSNSSDRKTSSPTEPHLRCEICGIKFQNMSLFQLHNVSMHAKLPTVESDDKKTMEAGEKSTNSADTISEDLQKLQTMILQLNDLDVNKASSTCTVCSKEFENRYYLHAHMMTEHGLLLDDSGDAEKTGEAEGSINNNTMCDLCGKDFHNFEDMKKHIIEAHTNTPISTPEVKEEFNNGFQTPDKGTVHIRTPVTSGPVIERRASMNLTPTSSYCEICNKELCNKYFMKTHMQRMHGIEIENGAQIGGVVCDICNKELCSKYFLRVHKHNTHGIVEYGTSLLQPRKSEEPPPPLPAEPDPALKPTDLADLSHRYFTHFTEVCTICSRRFRSTKWLKAHLLSDHGQKGEAKWAELEQQLQHTMNTSSTLTIKTPHGERVSPTLKIPNSGQEAPIAPQTQQKVGFQTVFSSIFGAADESPTKSYNCSYCHFTTPVLPFLFVHERSHSIQSQSHEADTIPLKCPVCTQTFQQPDLLQHHMFTHHPFLPLPPFFNGTAESQGEISKEPSECADETEDAGSLSDGKQQTISGPSSIKSKKSNVKRKPARVELPLGIELTLKDVAKRTQLPVAYALPQSNNSSSNGGGAADESSCSPSGAGIAAPYIMQAFLVEEPPAGATAPEHKFVPSIVFLPVLQKLSAPITATFTLTPA